MFLTILFVCVFCVRIFAPWKPWGRQVAALRCRGSAAGGKSGRAAEWSPRSRGLLMIPMVTWSNYDGLILETGWWLNYPYETQL